ASSTRRRCARATAQASSSSPAERKIVGYTLSDALATASLHGSAWAPIVEDDRVTDVTALDRAASAVASELVARGLGAGVRVAFPVENSAPHIATMFGVWRAGAVLVPLNPRLTAAEVEQLIGHSRAAARISVDRDRGSLSIEPRDAGRVTERGPVGSES